MKTRAPLEPELADELFRLWTEIFSERVDYPIDVFLGGEIEHNHTEVYWERRNGTMVASCCTQRSIAMPGLGTLGEVATRPQYRGKGLATDLCRRALTDFRKNAGEAIFLATANPVAARIYHRLGWRKLARADVMANITSGESPESFLVDYFRRRGLVMVSEAGPDVRVPMVPLLLASHDWQILDANPRMYSTRYDVQNSCGGLYGRCHRVTQDGRGQWFAAATDDGRVVGLSSARLYDTDHCNVDGFAHKEFSACWPELMERAIGWGTTQNAASVFATLSVEDEHKQRLFESLGFRKGQLAGEFQLGGRKVQAIQYAMRQI